MAFHIQYAAASFTGLARVSNEDNLYVNGKYKQPDDDKDHFLSGQVPVSRKPAFGVFDGMGGESQGEMAAYTAASSFRETIRRKPTLQEWMFPKNYLRESCISLNRAVCEYADTHKIRSMGTTASLLLFQKDKVIWANLGDSRVYRIRPDLERNDLTDGDRIRQLSVDHIEKSRLRKKGPLTQFLGIPEREMQIEPHIDQEKLRKGMVYLICSDGVTDLLDEKDLFQFVSAVDDVQEAVKDIKEQIIKRGAPDNATLVLCKVGEGQE